MDIEGTDEELRGRQNDEFRALKECFADQLVDLRKLVKVSRNPKKRKRDKLWIPLEVSVKIESRPEPIAEFDLHIKCTRKYPLVPPAIGFKNVKGIGRVLIAKLHKQLKHEAANEEYKGQGCIALLIMKAQQFLEDHYRDLELNNKSFYDQMVDQKQTSDRKAEMNRKHRDEMDKLERERQVEEIRQKILRKRELFNESKKRRDSQSSTLENEADESTYDYEGDLDAESTTTSFTDEGETTNRINDIDEASDDEGTLVRSRRSTFFGSREIKSNEEIANEKQNLQSRVDLEYEVIEELGHGGFGTVYKVRNRVDSRLYALKKVKLNPDNETLNEKIMREVKLLSRLNHENVIRYYTAWNEVELREQRSKSLGTPSIVNDSAVSSKINQESCILSQRDLSSSSDDEDDDVYHTSYLINDKNVEKIDAGETTANYVVFETSDNKDENDIVESMKKALGPNLSDGESSGDEEMDSVNNSGARIKINRWLYIQMELGQGTLREAIDRGLPKQKDRARRFFREILDGLCHIHRQGIIHRDLKPVNIFLDSVDRPKIGDFGLATTNLFIVTQSSGPGIPTATAIKPNRMSLERLRLLASPDQGDSPDIGNKSGERLKYIHHNQTDNIGTPIYMSPELSATNEKARFAKVVYSHKVDVYSLGIIYFEMLYPFKTGHERIAILQDLRKKSIDMPKDVQTHLSKEDIELIKLLLTHDVSARPTSEKLLTSNLLPSVGLKERECQNIIKQVVQNRQARTHKHMLRLLFDQEDSYVDDFVFDFEDMECTSVTGKSDAQSLLKDFNTNTFILDQVKMKLEQLLRSKGFVNFVTPTLMPKYSAAKYYTKSQLEDVVMLMDKNSSILTLPYDLRLPFARTIARTNISYMNRFALERIFRQRQILGYHPDQLWELCVDIVTPPPPNGLDSHVSDAEVLTLMGDVIKSLPVLMSLKPVIKINHMQLMHSILSMLKISDNLVTGILNCITESLSVSLKRNLQSTSLNHSGSSILLASTSGGNFSALPSYVRDDLKKDLLASRLLPSVNVINNLINFIDIAAASPIDVMDQIVHLYNSKGLNSPEHLSRIKTILYNMDETLLYARGLGLDLPVLVSPGFVLNALRPVGLYSGVVTLLECRRHSKARNKQSSKTVILAVGGRYDKLIEKFSRNRSEVIDGIYKSDTTINDSRVARENRPKNAVGVSFEVEKLSRLVLEDYVDKIINSDPSTSPSMNQLIHLNNLLSPQLSTTSTSATNSSTNNSVSNFGKLLTNQLTLRYWPLDIAICSMTHPKSKQYISIISGFIKHLRDKGLMCNELLPSDYPSFTIEGFAMSCMENKIPYMMTIKCTTNSTTNGNNPNHNSSSNNNSNQSIDNFEDTSTSLHAHNQRQNSGNSSNLSSSPQSPSRGGSSPSSPSMASPSVNCTATLYQLDKGRLRELKRSDIPSMIEFLVKK